MFLYGVIQTRSTLDIVAKNQLNILIQLAQVDKHFANEERDMIYRICRERGFPEDKMVEMIRNAESIISLGALSPGQKFKCLTDCIQLMLVDNKIMDSELIFCRGIAIKLGFKKDVIDYLLAHQYEEWANQEPVIFREFAA
jgi:hypothetical protein